MPRYRFDYTSVIVGSRRSPQGESIVLRPLVVAVLTAPNGRQLDYVMLLDSGSDHCLLPLSAAGLLGMDISRMTVRSTGGIGNPGNLVYFDTVRITINKDLDFEVYAGFTAGAENLGVGLLGQTGFFSKFLVSFAHFSEEFHIQTRPAA